MVWPAIVSVPVRSVPGFAATAKWTLPLPVPLAPDVIVIQGSLLVAVHVHPALVETVTGEAPPPFLSTESLVGLIEYEHGALCVSVNVWLAIVSVPVRMLPVFAATVNATVPLPFPLAPDAIVIQGALLAEVHVHPVAAVTATGAPAPPDALMDALVGLIEYEHGALCVSVNVWPAIVIVPVRTPPAFAAIVNASVPLPFPLVPDVIVIQGALLVEVHVHPVAAVTATGAPAPPDALVDALVGLIE
jgi:hypothetical protein